MPKKLICFDLDGLYFLEQSFRTFKEKLAPHIEASKRDKVLALGDEMKAFKAGKLTENEYRNFVKKELDLDYSNEEIYAILRENYQIDPKVDQLVEKLRKLGYQTGICSNNFPTRIRELDHKFHFLDKFDIKVFSYETGFLKPNPEIFQELIKRSQLEPQNIIYSDDNENKIKGAKELGIQTFVFHNFDELLQDLKNCGVEL